MINRLLYQNLLDDLDFQKAIVVLGPRQVGKTTLINALRKKREIIIQKEAVKGPYLKKSLFQLLPTFGHERGTIG